MTLPVYAPFEEIDVRTQTEREYQDLVETALEASVYCAPEAHGLSEDEILEVAVRLGRGRGATKEAVAQIRTSPLFEHRSGRLQLGRNPNVRCAQFLLGRFQPVDPRNVDALNFPLHHLDKLYEEHGSAGAHATRAEFVKAGAEQRLSANDLHIAITILALGHYLTEKDGGYTRDPLTASYPMPSSQLNQNGMTYTPRELLGATLLIVKAVVDERGRRPSPVTSEDLPRSVARNGTQVGLHSGASISIKEDASRVLHAVAGFEKSPGDSRRGRYNLTGVGVTQALKEQQDCDMDVDRINEAVELLENSSYADVTRLSGTMPYSFSGVEVTPRGRLAYEESQEQNRQVAEVKKSERSTGTSGNRVFIGHGRSPVWRELKDFVDDRLGLAWDEFNREATAGLSTKERLETMLDEAAFAFLIMTGEDERADGAKRARSNVIHEIGLFQGRLGFQRAIVLLEDGCEEFSNIIGITQIRFSPGAISSKFEDIRRVLERERIAVKS
jgi:predicted nucleotide-binding protein